VAIRTISTRSGSVPIVVLALAADESGIAAAVNAGARGYVQKGSPIDEVIAAIRAAASGTPWLSQRAAKALLERRSGRNRDGYVTVPDDDLSPRETRSCTS
jgi:DNA-binding NarL/FixJ family response regulator